MVSHLGRESEASLGAGGDLRRTAVRDVRRGSDCTVVALQGEIDLYNADEVRAVLEQECAARPARLLVDMSEVVFLDSTALHALLLVRTWLPNWRGLTLVSPRQPVRRALEATGVDRVLRIRVATSEGVLGAA